METTTTATQLLQIHETINPLRAIVSSISYATIVPHLKPRPSASTITAFVTQVVLVIKGIRSAYLVDSFTLSLESLGRFGQELERKLQSPSLTIYLEESTEQVFFVNRSLLNSRIDQNDVPSWVTVTPPPSIIAEPTSFKQLLNQLKDVKAGVVCRVQPENVLDMVPLAAFLLEYPVAYVVRNPASYLSNIPLHVYECTFTLEQECLPLIKFSVPVECDIKDITAYLQDKFQPRTGTPISVSRTTAIFDRLAL